MENPAIRCFLPRENPRISRPYTTGIRRRLPIELSRHYPVTSTGHSAGNDRMEMPNPLENAGKPHDLTGNTLSTTMSPAHSPCGGTADATDLKSVDRKIVWVRFPSRASLKTPFSAGFPLLFDSSLIRILRSFQPPSLPPRSHDGSSKPGTGLEQVPQPGTLCKVAHEVHGPTSRGKFRADRRERYSSFRTRTCDSLPDAACS